MRFLFITLSLSVLLLSCKKPQSTLDTYLGFDISKDTIDSYVQQKMKALNIPGMSIAIINNGKIAYQNTFGFANMEEKNPVTNETIFEGASISKSVFAFFVMTFVEEGKLDLDKPLADYFPHPDITNDDRYKKITARMVLSHRSGFPNWREAEDDKQLKTLFEPGTEYLYSGEGFQYLAMVLRELENTDWEGLEKIFQNKIAKPIGLEHTVFIQTPYTRTHKAEPYNEKGERIAWENDYWFLKEDGKFYAPSSIHSEPMDFSKWMIAVMNKEVLSKESYKELLKPHSSVPFDGIDVSYTLGFLTPHFLFTDIYLHSGNNEGFTSWYALDTKKDWGFVLFTNSDNGEQLGQELFFYLMTGPDLTKLYLILGVIALAVLLILLLSIRFIIRKIKRKRKRNNM